MIAVDTTILIQAHREGLPQHKAALRRLRLLAEGNTPWGLPVFCLGEFIRVVTHPRILNPPSTLNQAFRALKGLLDSPMVRVLTPGARFPQLLEEAARAADARGNLAFDAQIVAVRREQGASRILTLDRDFARFPWVTVVTLNDSPR